MTKVKHPLLSLDAKGRLGDELVYGHRQGSNIVEVRPIPKDARSPGQLSWRHMFLKVVALWHALSTAEKEAWESLARERHMTGYAWFVSQALRPNPGIYLPLQGGTMSGDIDMAGHKIEDLPDPLAQQEPVTKQYFEDHAVGDVGEGHITILPWNYQSIGQGTWAFYADGVQWGAHFWRNTSTNDGDNLSYKVYLAVGTYTLRVLAITAGDHGIMDIYIGAGEVASFDWYSAVAVRNVRKTSTNISIASAGLKTLKVEVDGKHASASDFDIGFSVICLWRTA